MLNDKNFLEIAVLKEMASSLDLQSMVEKLSYIENRLSMENSELIIPLVGEYSAGKSSLINALIDTKLETAFDPTTASIFEIRFGCPVSKAIVFGGDGTQHEISDPNSLKNEDLADSELVQVFDTSTKMPKETVFVDTPGLSSLDPRHQSILTNYLPLADLILFVIDINQGVTASALRFFESVELAQKRIYVVITKCDSKPPRENEKQRKYIKENTKLPMEKIVCVSAEKNDMNELFEMIQEIQNDKNNIVLEIAAKRIEFTKKEMLKYVKELLESSNLSTEDLDKKIFDAKRGINSAKSQIDNFITELERSVDGIMASEINDFSRRIYNELEAIALNPPRNYDINSVAMSKIENLSNLTLNNCKADIIDELSKLSRSRRANGTGEPFSSLENLDLSSVSMQNFSYNINMELPELQELNKKIAFGVKAVAVAGAVVATAGVAGAAGAGAVGVAGTVGANAGKLIDVADTVSDVGSIVSNRRTMNTIKNMAGQMESGMAVVNQYDNQIAQYVPMQAQHKGIIEGLVSSITEKTHAKPQRKVMIENYISSTLLPEFKNNMKQISRSISDSVRGMLFEESKGEIEQLVAGLENLKQEKESAKSSTLEKIDLLKGYKKVLEA